MARTVRRRDLRRWIPRLEALNAKERARLPGVSKRRARQILAGAIVAESTMSVLDITEAHICPWALREGVLLRRIDALLDPGAVQDTDLIRAAVHPLDQPGGNGSGSPVRAF